MIAVNEYDRKADGNADAMVHAPLMRSMKSVVAMNHVGGFASDTFPHNTVPKLAKIKQLVVQDGALRSSICSGTV